MGQLYYALAACLCKYEYKQICLLYPNNNVYICNPLTEYGQLFFED